MVIAWHDATMGSPDDLDHQRLYAIARGDTSAFTALFETHAVALVSAANRLVHDLSVAEEVVQDVFLGVWRAGPSLRVEGSVRGYLYIAVRNSALKWLRHRGVEQRWLQSQYFPAEAASADDPAERFDAEDMDRRVRDAIGRLSPQAREILLLRWSEQMTYAEIAAALGLAVKTVENHIGRALKVLRRLLAEDRPDWG